MVMGCGRTAATVWRRTLGTHATTRVGGGFGIVRSVTPPRSEEELRALAAERERAEMERVNAGQGEAASAVDGGSARREAGVDSADEMRSRWNRDAAAGPEWGGPPGYEPTRYGDWAKNGRVSDF